MRLAKGGALEYCTVEGCGRKRVGWGLCGLHYGRLKRNGSWRPTHRSQARAETIAEDGTRLCYKCNTRKQYTVEYFPLDHRRPGELKGTCRLCLNTAVKRAMVSRRYGITLAELDGLIASQNGACAICKEPFTEHVRGFQNVTSRPHVDHCHKTGRVRGALCHHCNVLLGHAKDSTDLLETAIRYLRCAHANA